MTFRHKFRDFLPIILLFVILNAFFISAKSLLQQWNMDQDLVLGGNLFLFAITFFSFLIAKRGLQNENPHAFVRSVYTSILVKFFLGMIAAFIYIAIYKANLNKAGFFTCMGLYLVYTFIEVSILMKMLKHMKK